MIIKKHIKQLFCKHKWRSWHYGPFGQNNYNKKFSFEQCLKCDKKKKVLNKIFFEKYRCPKCKKDPGYIYYEENGQFYVKECEFCKGKGIIRLWDKRENDKRNGNTSKSS